MFVRCHMVQVWTQFRIWLRQLFSHWIASAGCATIAVLQLVYGLWHRDWPPIFSWVLLSACFIWASFLTWRDEHGVISNDSRRRTLYKVRDLISESKHKASEKYDSIGALIKFSDELHAEEDTIWVCEQLKAGGHDHPFAVLELTSNNALRGRWLNFLQEARASK